MSQTPTVLVTRPKAQAELLCQRLRDLGIGAVSFPLLTIEPVTPTAADHSLIARLDGYDDLIFVSRNAVTIALPIFQAAWPALPTGPMWLAVGSSTAAELAPFGIHAHAPKVATSEGLLDMLADVDYEGRKVLIVKGIGGRDLLTTALSERDARVDELCVYRRTRPQPTESLAAVIERHDIDFVMITSGESLEFMHGLAGSNLVQARITLFVPSDRIAAQAGSHGYSDVVVAAGANDDAMIRALKVRLAEY